MRPHHQLSQQNPLSLNNNKPNNPTTQKKVLNAQLEPLFRSGESIFFKSLRKEYIRNRPRSFLNDIDGVFLDGNENPENIQSNGS